MNSIATKGEMMLQGLEQAAIGHWILRHIAGEDPYACSFCGNSVEVYGFRYCPYCGSKMQEEVVG